MATYNWQQGGAGAAGGAAGGAAVGAGIGLLGGPIGAGAGALLGAGIGGGLGLLKGFEDKTERIMPELINRGEYNLGLGYAQGAYNDNNLRMQNLMGRWQGQQNTGMGFLSQYMNQPAAEYQYDPMAAQRLFLSQAPELQNLARRTVSDYAPDDLIRQEREMIMQQVGDTFGGSPRSGAFAQAASQALATPLLQRAQAQEQLRAQVAGQLLGTSQQNLNQNVLQAAQMGYQQQLADRARLLEGAQYMQGLGGQTLQGAGMYGQLAGQGLGMLGQLTQPVYATPDYRVTPGIGSTFFNTMGQVGQLGSGIAMLGGGGGGGVTGAAGAGNPLAGYYRQGFSPSANPINPGATGL